jgi:hypothetical protein
MMTTATLSLVILFSSLTHGLPNGIPTGNYITRSESYQGSYPLYYYGQQLAPYGYGQYMVPAYYSSGQGAFAGQNYGYTGRATSNGAVNVSHFLHQDTPVTLLLLKPATFFI